MTTRSTLYRVQAYTGTSVDVATGVRVGDPVNVAQPTDAAATEVVRRMAGLTNGTTYKFSVAARYGTVFSNESALSAAVAPEAAAARQRRPRPDGPARPDRHARRVRLAEGHGLPVDADPPAGHQPRRHPYQDPLLTITGATTCQAHLPVPAEVVREVRRQLLPVPADHDAHQRRRHDLQPLGPGGHHAAA